MLAAAAALTALAAWRLHDPTQEEFDLITSEVMLHPLAVEDAIHAHQRAKLERYDDTLFVVLKPLLYDKASSDIEVGEINLFLRGCC